MKKTKALHRHHPKVTRTVKRRQLPVARYRNFSRYVHGDLL